MHLHTRRTLDRGTGFYVQERLSKKKASLLGSGRCVRGWHLLCQHLLLMRLLSLARCQTQPTHTHLS
jgi:hypothetical protein